MNLNYKYNYVKELLRRYGLGGLIMKTAERASSPMLSYTQRFQEFLPEESELDRQRQHEFKFQPQISIVMPTYETPKVFLAELWQSIKAQTYTKWELCIADGSSSNQVESFFKEEMQTDSRIHYQKLSSNEGISGNTNAGLAMCSGEYIAMTDHDDVLSPNALFEMVRCLNEKYWPDERSCAMIYSDEDKISQDSKVHSRPHFKPDFNLEFLRRNNYICHFLMYSKELLQEVKGLRKEFDGAQDYDFVLRCVEAGAIIRHIPKILYHWRIHEGSTAGNSADKAYAFDNGCRAIEEHLLRCQTPGEAKVTTNLGVYQVRYFLRKKEYHIAVLAKEQKQIDALKQNYRDSFKITEDGREATLFFYYYLEHSPRAEDVSADYFLFLEKGIRVDSSFRVEVLLRIMEQDKVGIVVPRLHTKAKRTASCGMLYSRHAGLTHSLAGLPLGYKGYFLHNVIPKEISAAVLDCALVRKECYGDGKEYRIPFYKSAALCFYAQSLGYKVVVTPELSVRSDSPELTEHETLRKLAEGLRGEDPETLRFYEAWKEVFSESDPCYNKNLSLRPYHTYEMK
ncbi:MAG: glycosyltransferase family 2 protein [Lachnospiraceae bacterium]